MERFWTKVDRTEVHTTCWLFTGYLNKFGYGCFRDGKGKIKLAHRFSWELVNGPIQRGMTVHHKCSIRRCVNPSHLELITSTENIGHANSKRYALRFKCGHPNISTNWHGKSTCRLCWNKRRNESRRLYGHE